MTLHALLLVVAVITFALLVGFDGTRAYHLWRNQ